MPLKKSVLLRVCSMAALLNVTLTKIPFRDESLLNHLERFGYDIGEVRHIKVREVGAQHQPQPKAHVGIENT